MEARNKGMGVVPETARQSGAKRLAVPPKSDFPAKNNNADAVDGQGRKAGADADTLIIHHSRFYNEH